MYQSRICFYGWVILHCMDIQFYPSVGGRLVVSTFWLLRMLLLWTFIYVFVWTRFHFSWLYFQKNLFKPLRNCQFSIAVASFNIPPSHVWGLVSPCPCWYVALFDYSPPSRWEVVSLGFDLHFSNDYDVEHLFHVLIGYLPSLEKSLFESCADF